MSQSVVLLGVDGGGSSTIAWVSDVEGNVLAKAQAGPSNSKAVGHESSCSAINSAIREALRLAGLQNGKAAVACLGLAGCDRPEDRAILDDWNRAHGWAEQLLVVNDGELVLAAGTPEGWGVAVIAGTGSISVGRSKSGYSARAGGWGHIFGDEGSGYGTAIAALRLVAKRHDGRSRHDSADDFLTKVVCDAVGVSEPGGLVSAIYSPAFDRARIAGITASVVAASAHDSAIVRDLLEPAGRDLAATALAVAKQLEIPPGPLPLAMAGGFLLSSEPVFRGLCEGVRVAGYDVVPGRVEEPVLGALKLARRAWHASLTVDGEVARSRRYTFEELARLPESDQIRDVSRFATKRPGDGVSLNSILAAVQPTPEASYVTLHASQDDFHVSVPLEAIRNEAVIVYALNGHPLPQAKGGPFRFLIRDPSACHTSELDDCANVKFLDRIELTRGKGLDTRPQNDAEHEALHASQSS